MAITVNDAPIKDNIISEKGQGVSSTWAKLLDQLARVAQGKDWSAVKAADSSLLEGHAASYFLPAANATPRRCGDGTNNNEQTISAAGALTLAHGLVGVTDPALIQVSVSLICKTAEYGYSIGDILDAPKFFYTGSREDGASIVKDATNLNIRFGDEPKVYAVPNKTTGAPIGITLANWKAVFVAKM